jgi:hypothetical protein
LRQQQMTNTEYSSSSDMTEITNIIPSSTIG